MLLTSIAQRELICSTWNLTWTSQRGNASLSSSPSGSHDGRTSCRVMPEVKWAVVTGRIIPAADRGGEGSAVPFGPRRKKRRWEEWVEEEWSSFHCWPFWVTGSAAVTRMAHTNTHGPRVHMDGAARRTAGMWREHHRPDSRNSIYTPCKIGYKGSTASWMWKIKKIKK